MIGTTRRRSYDGTARTGYVLVAVLIVVVVLSLTAYQFTEMMTAEHRAAARSNDAAQVRMAASSGVHYAAAMLADPTSLNGQVGGNPYVAGAFTPQTVRAAGNSGAEARFALVAAANTGSGTYEQRFGAVTDESAKLNINALIQLDPSGEQLYAALMKLPNMTADVADAIVDWVDPDDDSRTSGAESSYYQGLGQPYRAKNGPLNTLDELLLVRGVTPQFLFGNDRNRNGLADDDPNGAQAFDRGLGDFLTVYGRELNVDSTGVLRVNVNESEDLPGLHQKLTARVGPDLADYILAYKLFKTSTPAAAPPPTTVTGGPAELSTAVSATLGTLPINRRRLKSVLDLINTQVTLPTAGIPNAPTVVVPSPLNDPVKLASLLATLMDATTTTTSVELSPRVNVNTAPREVLVAIPNMTEADADIIIARREGQNPTDPATVSGAWLLGAGGMNPTVFKSIEKYVTGRTMVYRVQSIGYFAKGGPVARAEAVIDTNQGAPRILYFRDLTDLDSPRGFEPPR